MQSAHRVCIYTTPRVNTVCVHCVHTSACTRLRTRQVRMQRIHRVCIYATPCVHAVYVHLLAVMQTPRELSDGRGWQRGLHRRMDNRQMMRMVVRSKIVTVLSTRIALLTRITMRVYQGNSCFNDSWQQRGNSGKSIYNISETW
jgi:hypothetical protein